MAHYIAEIQLRPPRIFGLPEEGWPIAKLGSALRGALDPTQLTPAERIGDPREFDHRLVVGFGLNGINYSIEDDQLRAHLKAQDVVPAWEQIERETVRLWRYMATVFPGATPLTFELVRIIEDEKFDVLPLVTYRGYGYFYDLDRLRSSILSSAKELSGLPHTPILDQALRYFCLGDRLFHPQAGGNQQWVGKPDDLETELDPVAFLQYYKALVTLTGETTEADHQRRYRKYGLDTRFYEHEIRPLHTLRNRYGVAHIASPHAPTVVSRDDVYQCRTVAANAIRAFAAWMRSESALPREDGGSNQSDSNASP